MNRRGPIRIPFRYAAGEAGSRFLAALRDEQRILGSRCTSCERVQCPASSFCPHCGGATPETVEVQAEGRVVSWTEIPGRGVYGLVQLEGADTALLHRLLGTSPSWAIGKRVRARFAEERTGSVCDIEGFEAMEGGES